MLDNLSANQWVAIAWIELLVVYAGYLYYLNWRSRKAPRDEAER